MTRQLQAAAPQAQSTPVRSGVLQRVCACGQHAEGGECEACRRKREGTLQRAAISADAGGAVAPPIVHEVLNSPGQPLDAPTRAYMEPRFGQDFGHVRVHADGQAAASARAVNALAYTVGSHVAFDTGRYRPDASEGRRLLAHELAHVVQQAGAAPTVQRLVIDDARPNAPEREAQQAANCVSAGQSVAIKPVATSAPLQRQANRAADDADEAPVLAPEEPFRWIGDPSQPVLVVRARWLISQGVARDESPISGSVHPAVIRQVLRPLAQLYPWASWDRLERSLQIIGLIVPQDEWRKDELQIAVHRSVFQLIGLPPDRPIQVFFEPQGVSIFVDTHFLYPEEGSPAPQPLAEVKPAVASQVVDAVERQVGAPANPALRQGLLDYVIARLPASPQVVRLEITERKISALVGESQWRAFVQRQSEAAGQAGAVIQLGGGAAVRLPPDLTPPDQAKIMELLATVFGDTPAPMPEPARVISLTDADRQALVKLSEDDDREALIALLRSRGGARAVTEATISDLIESARERLDWQRSSEALDRPVGEGTSVEPVIVPRPVRGRIRNPDRLVPGLEAQFQIEVLDQVGAFRLPHVHIQWYVRSVPGTTKTPFTKRDWNRYIEVRPQGLLNDRTFDVTFPERGTYVIDAFVNHNFYLPAHFQTSVDVVTESEILEEFRGRAEAGWGSEQRSRAYRFGEIAESEEFAQKGLGTALQVLVPGAPGVGLGTQLLPLSGYEKGTRAEGTLTEAAASDYAMAFYDHQQRLRDELKRLDEMIATYERSDDRNRGAIVEFIRERRDRVQAALDNVGTVERSNENPAHPVPVRAFYASRTHGFRSTPLTLVTYFHYEGTPDKPVYHGHILDQSEIVESQHFHFEQSAGTYEGMMEALFLDLTRSYPNGTISFAFQLYDALGPTPRFVRFERVTDTVEKDVKNIAFSNTAGLVVNVLSALLTVFPPTAPIGIAIGLAYNAAALAAELEEDIWRGTVRNDKWPLDLGLLALDIIPVVGRGSRLLVIGGRTYKVLEATQIAGALYLMTEEAERAIQMLRDGEISELARVQERIRSLDAVNPSDPELTELRKQELQMIESIRFAASNVIGEMVVNQGLTIGSAALARRLAEPYVTGRIPAAGGTPPPAKRVDTSEPADKTPTRESEPAPTTSAEEPRQHEQAPALTPDVVTLTRRTRDNAHELTLTGTGRIIRCSDRCRDLALRYAHILDNDPELRARMDDLQKRAQEAADSGSPDRARQVIDDAQAFEGMLRDAEKTHGHLMGMTDEELDALKDLDVPPVTGGPRSGYKIDDVRIPYWVIRKNGEVDPDQSRPPRRLIDLHDVRRPGEGYGQAAQRMGTIMTRTIAETPFAATWEQARKHVLRGRDIATITKEEMLGVKAKDKKGLYAQAQRRFWALVRKQPELVDYLAERGFVFESASGAPVVELSIRGASADAEWRMLSVEERRISLDHQLAKALDDNYQTALDGDKLEFMFQNPNANREIVQMRFRMRDE